MRLVLEILLDHLDGRSALALQEAMQQGNSPV
jgi:hypothetical protein